MATKIELPSKVVGYAFKAHLQSLKRARNNATNELIQKALDDEIRQITHGIDTMTDTK